jgi:hypothetical protein
MITWGYEIVMSGVSSLQLTAVCCQVGLHTFRFYIQIYIQAIEPFTQHNGAHWRGMWQNRNIIAEGAAQQAWINRIRCYGYKFLILS